MHSYLLRMRDELFDYVKVEADNRGVSINFLYHIVLKLHYVN